MFLRFVSGSDGDDFCVNGDMTPRIRRLLGRRCAQLWWVNTVLAPVLLPLLAGVVGLLLVYYALEWDSGNALPSGYSDLVPTSPANGVVIAAVGAGLAFLALRAAREWPTTANVGRSSEC